MTYPLIRAWEEFDASGPPFLLRGDEALLEEADGRPGFVVHRSLAQYASSAAFGNGSDRRLHLGLRPIPFAGLVQEARIYLLMLNPGLSPADYFAEWHQPRYAEAATENLKGKRTFLFLDPEFAWHPGFTYWYGKLTAVVRALVHRTGLRHGEVLRHVARSLCLIQLLPYHSPAFGVPRRLLCKLRSSELAKQFVAEVVVPRARAGEALVIVARHATYWEVPSDCAAVVYEGSAARSAHLTPNSSGGARILEALTMQMSVPANTYKAPGCQ